MGVLNNTTNIPDKLVAIMVAFAMPPDCAEFISCIRVKNKMRDKVRGQWGWYYPSDGTVVIIVPRVIKHQHMHTRRYSHTTIVINSRAEFLVAVLAHEMRHAWQQKNWNTELSKWKLAPGYMGKYAREFDAEMYEIQALDRWKRQFGSLIFND